MQARLASALFASRLRTQHVEPGASSVHADTESTDLWHVWRCRQVIDDTTGHTLAAANTMMKDVKAAFENTSTVVGGMANAGLASTSHAPGVLHDGSALPATYLQSPSS